MVEQHSHAVIETDAILRGAESIPDCLNLTLAHRFPDLEEIPKDTFCAWRSRQRPKPMAIAVWDSSLVSLVLRSDAGPK